jgi:hypothetical protein
VARGARSHGEIDHLSGEDEDRYEPNERRGFFVEFGFGPFEGIANASGRQQGRTGRGWDVDKSIRNMHPLILLQTIRNYNRRRAALGFWHDRNAI